MLLVKKVYFICILLLYTVLYLNRILKFCDVGTTFYLFYTALSVQIDCKNIVLL